MRALAIVLLALVTLGVPALAETSKAPPEASGGAARASASERAAELVPRSEPKASEGAARASASERAAELVPRSEPKASEGASWARELERELMSPYCPGRSLIECPSQQAAELRLWIAAQEKAGLSRESVEAQLFRRFGDQLRQSPRAEGFGLFAYLVPGAALLAGLGLVVVFLRRQSAGDPTHGPSAPGSVDPELERELEDELRAS